jgi:hypothetical protein
MTGRLLGPSDITRSQALAVRRDYEQGATLPALAGTYGMSMQTLSGIIQGRHQWTQGLPNISRGAGRPCDHGRLLAGQRRCKHAKSGKVML